MSIFQDQGWILSLVLFLSFAGVFFYAAMLFEPPSRKRGYGSKLAKRVAGIEMCSAVLIVNGWFIIVISLGAWFSDLTLIALLGSSAVLLATSVLINVIKLRRPRNSAQG